LSPRGLTRGSQSPDVRRPRRPLLVRGRRLSGGRVLVCVFGPALIELRVRRSSRRSPDPSPLKTGD
jgi:hypothetical protein